MNYSTHIVCTLLPLLLDKAGSERIAAAARASVKPNLAEKIADVTERPKIGHL